MASGNCEACWHLWTLHGPDGCTGKVFPSYSLTGEPCPCEHASPEAAEAADAGWHPSCGELIAKIACPVCSAAPGFWCEDAEIPAGERDIHIDRILLARGLPS